MVKPSFFPYPPVDPLLEAFACLVSGTPFRRVPDTRLLDASSRPCSQRKAGAWRLFIAPWPVQTYACLCFACLGVTAPLHGFLFSQSACTSGARNLSHPSGESRQLVLDRTPTWSLDVNLTVQRQHYS